LVLWLAGSGSAPAAPPTTLPAFAPDSTGLAVFLVRHAEKNPHPPGGDAGLAEAGRARARVLARVLRDAGVAAVYASPFGRAQETARPLAQGLGDSVRTYDAHDPEGLAARLLRDHRGQAVAVVGHSDTIAPTLEALCGRGLEEGESVDYDRLYLLWRGGDGASRLWRLRYGEAVE
jgi:phosphohistidine phosphatase SixA